MEFQKIEIKDEDFLPLINQVMLKFGDKPEVCDSFLKCLISLNSESPDMPSVIGTFANLFSEHPEFIVSLNFLLPAEFRININFGDQTEVGVSSEDRVKQVTFTHYPAIPYFEGMKLLHKALDYIHKVKEKCEASVYNDFLSVLQNLHYRNIDVQETAARVASILYDYPDLVMNLNEFLPPECKIRRRMN